MPESRYHRLDDEFVRLPEPNLPEADARRAKSRSMPAIGAVAVILVLLAGIVVFGVVM